MRPGPSPINPGAASGPMRKLLGRREYRSADHLFDDFAKSGDSPATARARR